MIKRLAFLCSVVLLLISCNANHTRTSTGQIDVSSYENEISRLRNEINNLQHYVDSLSRENQAKEQIIAEIRNYFK